MTAWLEHAGRRGILGGLAALPVLYSVASAAPALATLGRCGHPASGQERPDGAGDLVRGAERRYNAPLLTAGTRLMLPAGVKAVPVLDYYHRPHLARAASAWPHIKAADGTTVDASVIPDRGAPTRVAILSGFTEGWYELAHASGRADRVTWDARKLPFLFVHGEFGGTDEEPFRGRFYTPRAAADVPQPLPPQHHHSLGEEMSHHFDYTADERLDISDAYCFAGPSDAFGPRTVFGMNASPNDAGPWDPAGYYELKVDTNEDLVEDITWRFTFPVDSAGVQHVVVAELRGREATDRNAQGRIITPPNAPVGEVIEVERGIKIFAGPRTDSFFNFLPFPITLAKALNEGFFPDLAALFPPTDFFMRQIVQVHPVEVPAEITGLRRLNYWATTAVYDQGHGWVQLQRAGGPNGTTLWDFTDGSRWDQHQRHRPVAGPRGQARPPRDRPRHRGLGPDQGPDRRRRRAGGTYNQGVHGRPTALAYGAYVADVFLPMVIPFIPGTNALWDPWQGSHNGKGLTEDAFDNATKVILNQDFVSGLTQPAKLLDYFPYLAPPPES